MSQGGMIHVCFIQFIKRADIIDMFDGFLIFYFLLSGLFFLFYDI